MCNSNRFGFSRGAIEARWSQFKRCTRATGIRRVDRCVARTDHALRAFPLFCLASHTTEARAFFRMATVLLDVERRDAVVGSASTSSLALKLVGEPQAPIDDATGVAVAAAAVASVQRMLLDTVVGDCRRASAALAAAPPRAAPAAAAAAANADPSTDAPESADAAPPAPAGAARDEREASVVVYARPRRGFPLLPVAEASAKFRASEPADGDALARLVDDATSHVAGAVTATLAAPSGTAAADVPPRVYVLRAVRDVVSEAAGESSMRIDSTSRAPLPGRPYDGPMGGRGYAAYGGRGYTAFPRGRGGPELARMLNDDDDDDQSDPDSEVDFGRGGRGSRARGRYRPAMRATGAAPRGRVASRGGPRGRKAARDSGSDSGSDGDMLQRFMASPGQLRRLS
jgi:hypothetical protein